MTEMGVQRDIADAAAWPNLAAISERLDCNVPQHVFEAAMYISQTSIHLALSSNVML